MSNVSKDAPHSAAGPHASDSLLDGAHDAKRLLGMTETLAHVGHWRYDLVTLKLFWSDEVKRIHGFPLGVTPTVEAALNAYVSADRERITLLLRNAVEEGRGYSLESRIVRSDGAIRDVATSGSVEAAPDGRAIGVIGIIQDVTDRKAMERERDRLLERVTLAAQAGRIGIWDFDVATATLVWDRNMFALYAIDPGTSALYQAWSNTLHPDDRVRVLAELRAALRGPAALDTEFRAIWTSGDVHIIRSLGTVVRDSAGDPVRMVGTNWDITEVRTLAEQLRSEKDALSGSEARYRALTEAIPSLVSVVDSTGDLGYVNARWILYTGFTLDNIHTAGRACLFDREDLALVDSYRKQIPAKEFECEVRIRRHDGAFRWHLYRSVPLAKVSGLPGQWIVSATDIEDRKNAEVRLADAAAELRHLAHHDPLTNLPNRKLLMERLTQAMAQADRSGNGVMVLYVDIDRFKSVNDRLGHAAGDEVLAATARRITQTLRAGDTASRVGGDEFVLVCANREDGERPALLASRLLATIAQPIVIDGSLLCVNASIGASQYPADGAGGDALLRKADAAMYAAKTSGRNAFRGYTADMDASVAQTVQFAAELRAALANNELVVYYQPMIAMQSGRLIGAEALVRWHHPRRGLLQPGSFIPFAEEHGLIEQIGDFVLNAACDFIKGLGVDAQAEFSIAVNVSAHQFARSDFVPRLAAAIAARGIDVARLEIEITESIVMGNTTATVAVLRDLKVLGVKLSLDDFGTGFSSLAYIKNFPIDTLKIDRSFVRDVATNRTDQALAKTIITLGHSLGMRVVGEGIETQAQLKALCRFGADICQGFLVSRPIAGAEFERFRQTYRPADFLDTAAAE